MDLTSVSLEAQWLEHPSGREFDSHRELGIFFLSFLVLEFSFSQIIQ